MALLNCEVITNNTHNVLLLLALYVCVSCMFHSSPTVIIKALSYLILWLECVRTCLYIYKVAQVCVQAKYVSVQSSAVLCMLFVLVKVAPRLCFKGVHVRMA